MIMNANELKEFIASGSTTVVFMYNGKHACIDMNGTVNDFDAGFGDEVRRYHSIDDVMNDKLYDGKSLNEIAEEIDVN